MRANYPNSSSWRSSTSLGRSISRTARLGFYSPSRADLPTRSPTTSVIRAGLSSLEGMSSWSTLTTRSMSLLWSGRASSERTLPGCSSLDPRRTRPPILSRGNLCLPAWKESLNPHPVRYKTLWMSMWSPP
uniref:Uncharacterized protein n=1 Tax=Cacopsylla melanoneura TaxID=428564 RepID=A0A8D8TR26_9HEMI